LTIYSISPTYILFLDVISFQDTEKRTVDSQWIPVSAASGSALPCRGLGGLNKKPGKRKMPKVGNQRKKPAYAGNKNLLFLFLFISIYSFLFLQSRVRRLSVHLPSPISLPLALLDTTSLMQRLPTKKK
jgi:hypothetical protein